MAEPELNVNEYMIYLQQYRMLICRSCEQAIRPNNDIERHLRNKHRAIPHRVHKVLIEYAKDLELVNPDNISIPDGNGPPIEGLKVIHK